MLSPVNSTTAYLLFAVLVLFSARCFGFIAPSYKQTVKVCDATAQPDWPVDFSAPGCLQIPLLEVDPQNKALWLQIPLELTAQQITQLEPPLALYLYAKASSSVYLNGHHLGDNGLPGKLPDEIAGKMDVRFFVPHHLLQQGENQLVIKMSAQHSFLSLPNPVHFVAVAHYQPPQFYLQQHSESMLLLLGVLLASALYFAVRCLQPLQRSRHILLALMSFFAAAQLCAEIARGLFSYAYPIHDLRLLLITALSFAFGLCLLIFIAQRFAKRHSQRWIYTGVILTLLLMLLVPGFDNKTTIATFIPVIVSVLLTAQHWHHSRGYKSAATVVTLSLFVVIIGLTADYFHENLYFLLVTLLLGFLFMQQAKDYNVLLSNQQLDKERLAKLTLRLEQNQQHSTPATLKIVSAGKVDIINTADITFCQAAGDYSEINLLDSRQHLYNGTLKSLESELPSTFLRVHRSYLVNLQQVKLLTTSTDKSSGSAASLFLHNGLQLPVSRRLIPSVRQAVKSEKT